MTRLARELAREAGALRRALWTVLLHRGLYPDASRAAIVDAFHRLYHDAHRVGGTWQDTRWLGVRVAKTPLDLWVYQELLVELRPGLVIETGTAWGGSARFLATVLDELGCGRILTIDVADRPGRPAHPRVEYLCASSTAPAAIARAEALAAETEGPVLVLLDSDHSQRHVAEELRLYAPLVTRGSYLVVEDTNVNGNPVAVEHGPGPAEAVRAFLAEDDRFEVDPAREKHFLTFNPGGYLRRV